MREKEREIQMVDERGGASFDDLLDDVHCLSGSASFYDFTLFRHEHNIHYMHRESDREYRQWVHCAARLPGP